MRIPLISFHLWIHDISSWYFFVPNFSFSFQTNTLLSFTQYNSSHISDLYTLLFFKHLFELFVVLLINCSLCCTHKNVAYRMLCLLYEIYNVHAQLSFMHQCMMMMSPLFDCECLLNSA